MWGVVSLGRVDITCQPSQVHITCQHQMCRPRMLACIFLDITCQPSHVNISCPYHISHVNITHRPAKLSEHLWRYPMVKIKCLQTKQAFIFVDITCQHSLWGYPVLFFTYSILLRILPRLVYYLAVAAVAIDLSRPLEDCRTKLKFTKGSTTL